MRKILCALMSVVLLFSLCSCSVTMPFEEEQLALVLSDGNTGRTDLVINRDGTFTGTFINANPDDVASDYPDGTVRICNFSGEFTKIAEHSDGGVRAMRALMMTCTRYPGIKKVKILVDGKPYQMPEKDVPVFANVASEVTAVYDEVLVIE